jgi:anthranilate synthase component 2
MKLLLLDNYDSFTYNLAHVIEKVSEHKVDVRRNNEIELSEFNNYSKIVLSPGPGLPQDAGIMLEFIKKYYQHKSILGVCLGHQALAAAFGIGLINLKNVFHGVATPTTVLSDEIIFKHVPKQFLTGRYHSWIVSKEELHPHFRLTAIDQQGNCMAIQHNEYDLCGLQFHPESILTENGEQLLKNWINN